MPFIPLVEDPLSGGSGVPRVGRLVPLSGIPTSQHPDRGQLQQFLRELRLPLAASRSLLDLVEFDALPPAAQMAMHAVVDHYEYLLDLVGDFAEFGQLEADLVPSAPARTALGAWIDGCQRNARQLATTAGHELRVVHRSFLPTHVQVDAGLLQRAVLAVLRVALVRALGGTCEVRIAYLHGRAHAGPGRLQIEIVTAGGGFDELEQGYVFAPFVVRDGAARPRLGLSIAHRLCQLLGGELRLDSPGRSACCYRLEVPAAATADAQWFDPLGGAARMLGPVCPGRVLFVGASADTRTLCAPLLQRSGFTLVDTAADAGAVAGQLRQDPAGWSALVFPAAVAAQPFAAVVAAARAAGFVGTVVLEADAVAPCGDATVACPELSGRALLAVLRRGVMSFGDEGHAAHGAG